MASERLKDRIEFITASAGTGKTYRLVEVVHEAVSSGAARPEAVLATTFTNSAAHELTERLTSRFHAAGLHEQALLLRQGLIGTVHGICLRLLQRFPFEAGLSPDLQILDEAGAETLLNRALDEVVDEDSQLELYRLGDRLDCKNDRDGSYDWSRDIRSIVGEARSNEIEPSSLPDMGTASWKEMQPCLPSATEADLDSILSNAIDTALAEMPEVPATKGSKAYRQLLQRYSRLLENDRLNWADWAKLAKEKPTKDEQPMAEPVQDTAARHGEHKRFHEDLSRYLGLLFGLASGVSARYQELKRERSVVDFADLEKDALDLIRNSDSVRAILSEELDLLVVDEFQDTSPIQLALFSELARCTKRVVWVGDIKQSIFEFRGADPDLIRAAVSGATKSDTLDQSWRSVPDIVNLCSELFTAPFVEKLDLAETEVRLHAHRDAANEPSGTAVRIAKIDSGIIQKNKKPKRLTKGQRPSVIADAIQHYLASGEQIVDKLSITPLEKSGQTRPVTQGDVAVLARTQATAAAIAEELRNRGFDVTYSTSGLLETPECRLALACLRWLADARDTLAAAEIVALENQHSTDQWLTDRLEHLANCGEDDYLGTGWGVSGELKSKALGAISESRHEQQSLQSPLAIFDTACAAADVSRITASWGRTPERVHQRHANLSRLRDHINEFETSAAAFGQPATLNGLFGWLELLGENGLDKRALDPAADAIYVGTYHGAKGLEWPTVFAADLDYPTRSRLFNLRPILVDPEAGIDFDHPLAGRELRWWINPFGRSNSPIFDTLEDSPQGHVCHAAAESEELRLLYVGLTRARDHLILIHEPACAPTWLDIAAPGVITGEAAIANQSISFGEDTEPIAIGVTNHIYREEVPRPEPASSVEVATRTAHRSDRLPLIITPSSQPAIAEAKVTEVVEFGERLTWSGTINERDLGDAMHRIIAAEVLTPEHPDREARANRILSHWSLDSQFPAPKVLEQIDHYRKWLQDTFAPTSQQVEIPFTLTNEQGQRSSGFIDHLLTTEKGSVIIDHKIFPGKRDQWERRALGYSGQLAMYGNVVASNGEVATPPETWIHFVSTGAALRINPNPSSPQ